jgi:hypothetical protein
MKLWLLEVVGWVGGGIGGRWLGMGTSDLAHKAITFDD